jgi:drug/metabolite transporter (DMT)-like permease
MHDEHNQRLGAGAVSLTLLTAVLWGGTSVANRFAVDTVPPIAVGGIRFAMAAVFMLAWCRLERSPIWPAAGQWRPSMIAGLLLFLQIATFNVGIERSTASHGTLFINTFVFWVAAIEHFVTREHRLNLRQLAGLLIAAAGVVLLVGDEPSRHGVTSAASLQDRATLFGDLCLLVSAFLLAVKIIYTKWAVRYVPPGTLTLWHDVFGVGLFAAASVLFERFEQGAASTLPAILGLLYLGIVVSGFCFAAQAWLLKRHRASLISVFSFATPVCGVFLAVLLRGDALSPWLLISGTCVAIGIVLVTRPTQGASEQG